MQGPAVCASIWKENSSFVNICVGKPWGRNEGGGCGSSCKAISVIARGTAQEARKWVLVAEVLVACSQPPSLAPPEHFAKGSPPQFFFNSSHHVLGQGWSPWPPLPIAELKSFTGHTVGIFVKMWKCLFSTFWCPMGIMYLIRALFWFLDCLWFKNPERKLLCNYFNLILQADSSLIPSTKKQRRAQLYFSSKNKNPSSFEELL